ncbi:alcohol dehydrogenase, iron-containing domain protein [Burkholderia pseudomallei MSHR3335]|nr:alcohol dehydrogenase, iron-containing domain protein [Burkholderia pseudomallei MSHR3335]
MPVAAVSAGGIATIRLGSSIAMSGVQRQSTIAIFT